MIAGRVRAGVPWLVINANDANAFPDDGLPKMQERAGRMSDDH
jgi:hypothetical protein